MDKPKNHKKDRNRWFCLGIVWGVLSIGTFYTNQLNGWLWKLNLICFILYLLNAYKEHKKINK